MEEYRNCPICFEIPEKEIYQCAAGHIICNVCIQNLTECPQCRAKYGGTKIRSRVLEALLDSQEFECKFSDEGCGQICKRSEISNHGDSCKFNPENVPFCNMVGTSCLFGLGCCTRQQVIDHFQGVHKFSIGSSKITRKGDNFMTRLNQLSNQARNNWRFNTIINMDNRADSQALFICCAVLSNYQDFISFTCTQVWKSKTDLKKYKLNCKFVRKNSVPGRSLSNVAINPFPISLSIKVSSLKDIETILQTGVVGIPIELLKTARFGEEAGDELVRNKY